MGGDPGLVSGRMARRLMESSPFISSREIRPCWTSMSRRCRKASTAVLATDSICFASFRAFLTAITCGWRAIARRMKRATLQVAAAEALYADMGHFGRFPIQAAWFLIVMPA